MPDSIGQQDHSAFEKKRGAETARTAKAVPVGLVFHGSGESGRVADRYHDSGHEERRRSSGANCRGSKLVDGLTWHDEDSHSWAHPGGSMHPSGILPLFLLELCDLHQIMYVIYITLVE